MLPFFNIPKYFTATAASTHWHLCQWQQHAFDITQFVYFQRYQNNQKQKWKSNKKVCGACCNSKIWILLLLCLFWHVAIFFWQICYDHFLDMSLFAFVLLASMIIGSSKEIIGIVSDLVSGCCIVASMLFIVFPYFLAYGEGVWWDFIVSQIWPTYYTIQEQWSLPASGDIISLSNYLKKG